MRKAAAQNLREAPITKRQIPEKRQSLKL